MRAVPAREWATPARREVRFVDGRPPPPSFGAAADRRYTSETSSSKAAPFPQRSLGVGGPRLRSVDQSPVVSAFAFFTAFLVL
jgi:hypothetical protein